jgi:hypothetical protein
MRDMRQAGADLIVQLGQGGQVEARVFVLLVDRADDPGDGLDGLQREELEEVSRTDSACATTWLQSPERDSR